MNPNPTIDDDLQKAIDDITNNTNNDPVFDDTIAAPEPVTASKPAPASRPASSFPEVGMPPAPKPKAPAFKPAPMPPAPKPVSAPAPEPEAVEAEYSETTTESEPTGELRDVRESILRDLAPMVSKLDMEPKKKFDIYKNIREELHDDSVIASAYEVTKEMTEDERADALLYLYNSLQ